MIDHFGINVKDIEANKAFYEAALAPLGYAKTIGEEHMAWALAVQTVRSTRECFGLGKVSPPHRCISLLLRHRGRR